MPHYEGREFRSGMPCRVVGTHDSSHVQVPVILSPGADGSQHQDQSSVLSFHKSFRLRVVRRRVDLQEVHVLHHLRGQFCCDLAAIIRLDSQWCTVRMDPILQEDLTGLFSITLSVWAGLCKLSEVINDHQDTKVTRFSFCKFQVVYLDKFIGCSTLQRLQRKFHPLLGWLAGLTYKTTNDISCHVLVQCWPVKLLQDQIIRLCLSDVGLLSCAK